MRYLRLYLHFLQFSFSKAFEFRLDFFFRVFMDLIYYLVNIFFFKVLFLNTPLVAGWTGDQMMVFVASYLLVDALNMTIFSSNLWWLPTFINKGELDYYLIRPVSPLFFLSLRDFSANSFLNLLMAAGFFAYALTNSGMTLTLFNVTLLVLLIFNGTLLHYFLQMLMILPVFWTHSSRGFVDLFYSMGMAMERPDRIYRGALRVIFTMLLPFALIASFPAKIFIEGLRFDVLLHLGVVTVIFGVLLSAVWRAGLRNYSSASS